MMFESALKRFLHDLVVTMILALILKGTLPRAAISELGKRKHFDHALRKRNHVAERSLDREVRLRLCAFRVCFGGNVFHFQHAIANVYVALRKRKINTSLTKFLCDSNVEIAAIPAAARGHFSGSHEC